MLTSKYKFISRLSSEDLPKTKWLSDAQLALIVMLLNFFKRNLPNLSQYIEGGRIRIFEHEKVGFVKAVFLAFLFKSTFNV